MRLLYLFTFCLIAGMVCSQLFPLTPMHPMLTLFANTVIAYIMMGVGLEFWLDKRQLKTHLKDYGVAALAATAPWLLCFLYFLFVARANGWEELLLLSRFAAPTSSGILFSMLATAGLGASWVYQKVHKLSILDDVDTVLFLIPLQLILVGIEPSLIAVLLLMGVLLILGWRFLHSLRIPTTPFWLFAYSVILALLLHTLEGKFELDILLPALIFGVILCNQRCKSGKRSSSIRLFDHAIKALFMLIVGLSLPKIALGTLNPYWIAWHVIAITLISNAGKCFPLLFYRKEASFKERSAVSIGMFPRGELGAGILLLALEYGVGGDATVIVGFSLALNLLLTGFFTWCVFKLVRI